MRFSIRVLLLLVFLIAIVLAALASERPGNTYKRIASIEFSPAGYQMAVNVLEKNGYQPEEPCVFHRTISIVNYPSLETGSVVRRDTFRCETPNEIFWHSQTDVNHTKTHLVFLNQNKSSLMLYDLSSGAMREWARYVGGEIWSFNASADARRILVSGRHPPPDPEGEALTVDGESYYLNRDSGLKLTKRFDDSFCFLALFSESGIGAKELITTPFDEEALSHYSTRFSSGPDGPVDEDLDKEWLAGRPRVVTYGPLDPALKPRIGRYLIVPRDESEPGDTDSIGIAFSIESTEMDPVTLEPVGKINYRQDYNKRSAPLYDVATSRGSCRFARVAENNRVILNFVTDEIPSTDNIDLRVQCPTDSESVVTLSKDGDLVAVSHDRDIKVFDTSTFLSGYRPGMIDEMKQYGYCHVFADPLFELKNAALTTAVAFSRDEKFLVAGDDEGYISMFDLASGERVKRERSTGRMPGLPRFLLFPMIAVWLILAAAMYFGRKATVVDSELSEQGVQFLNH